MSLEHKLCMSVLLQNNNSFFSFKSVYFPRKTEIKAPFRNNIPVHHTKNPLSEKSEESHTSLQLHK